MSTGLNIDQRARQDAHAITPEWQLQLAFSEVLQQAGREGYASIPTEVQEVEKAHDVAASWNEWFDSIGHVRYRFHAGVENPSVRKDKNAEDLKQDYGNVLWKAYQQGGYASPVGFVQSLTTEELQAIQQVQHLADPIETHGLSEEAALNLLIPPDAQVDSNRDGLTAVGAAYTIRFPDSNTPTAVRQAWEAATANMPEEERLHRVLEMTFPVITANLEIDAEGIFVGSRDPGDPHWVNPFASPSFSYREMANQWLDYLDHFRSQIPPDQYQRDVQFWRSFREHLAESI